MRGTKATLHAVIDEMNDEQAEDLLDYLNMLTDPEALSEEEASDVESGLEEIARGESVTLDELRHDLGRNA